MGNYRSALTVRAHTTPELPGTEFCLTGFEDPGVQLPETIITWVSIALSSQHICLSVSDLECFNRGIFRLQLEGCLSSCWHWEQPASSYERRGKIARGILPSYLYVEWPKNYSFHGWRLPSLFTLFPQLGSSGGQLWTNPPTQTTATACCLCLTSLSTGFLSVWMNGLASFHHVERALCKNLSHRAYLSAILCSPLAIDEALQKSCLNEVILTQLLWAVALTHIFLISSKKNYSGRSLKLIS